MKLLAIIFFSLFLNFSLQAQISNKVPQERVENATLISSSPIFIPNSEQIEDMTKIAIEQCELTLFAVKNSYSSLQTDIFILDYFDFLSSTERQDQIAIEAARKTKNAISDFVKDASENMFLTVSKYKTLLTSTAYMCRIYID